MPKIIHEDERIIEILSMFATELKTGRGEEADAIDKTACMLTAYMEGMVKASVDGSMAEELARALEKACEAVCELIDNSRGVDGLHLNGDVAEWDDLRSGGRYESWLVEFDEALDVSQKYQQSKVQP